MRNCCHNDVIGLANRYCKESDNPINYDLGIVNGILDELAQHILRANNGSRMKPITLLDFLDSRTGHSKQRYCKAFSKMQKRQFDPVKDSGIKAFIKNEKYSEHKPPREIMGRDPVFNLLYGRYTIPLEKLLKHVPGFDKGKDFFEMGKFMEKYVGSKHFMDCDFSKFESTQREALLKLVECGLWKRILAPEYLPYINSLFRIKMVKKGVTTNGVQFQFYACRGSGDMDTWLFNTILNWVACRYFEIVNKTGNTDFITTGDDSNIAVPMGFSDPIDTFKLFGFDSKLRLLRDPYDVEFCSSKYIEYFPGRWMLCPNIKKICNNIGLMINSDFNKCIGHYYYSIGYMYSVLFPNFPFFSQLSSFLMGITKNPKVRVNTEHLKFLNPMYLEFFREGSSGVQCSQNMVEVGFMLAFSLQRTELNQIYHYLSTTKVNVTFCDKVFRKRGNPTPPPTPFECEWVQQSMESRLLSTRPQVNRFVKAAKKPQRDNLIFTVHGR